MPAYTTWGGDPTPLGAEAPNVPAVLGAYAASIDPKLVLAVANQAERDARFLGLPAGALVTCPTQRIVWMSKGQVGSVQNWETVYYDSGWLTGPSFNWQAGWADQGESRVRQVGAMVYLYVYATYSGDTITAGANGGLADQNIVTVPVNLTPPNPVTGVMRSGQSSGTGWLGPDGILRLIDARPTASWAAGDYARGNFVYLLGA